MQYKGSYSVGQTLKLGACMVWQKEKMLSGSDGAGHVAIVEKIISDTEVYTSESGCSSKAFWNQTRTKGTDGRWGEGSSYTFLGFIYNPAVKTDLPSSASEEYLSVPITAGDVVKVSDAVVYYGGTKSVPA